MTVLLLLVIGGLMHATRTFTQGSEPGTAGISLGVGYLLISAYLGGRLAADLGLPKLTGYLITGLLAGPYVLSLLSSGMVNNLTLVNGIAVSLIALTAGAELDLRALKPLLRHIAGITVVGVLGTALLLTLTVWLLRAHVPSFAGLDLPQSISVALVLAVVMVAQSPAVVVALKNELGAEGAVMRTVLGVVVLADLLVILLFTITSTVAKAALSGSADLGRAFADFGWEIGGSLTIGAAVGALLALYLKNVKQGSALFLLAVTFVIAEVGGRLHLDPLLTALSAGMFVRNMSSVADILEHQIQSSALPVYVLFFSVAGANLPLGALSRVLVPALILVAVRATGFLLGSRLGARLSGAPDAVRRFAGFGLLPQSGLAIALSLLLRRSFPELGPEASGLTLGIVAINELIAPTLFRQALVRSGEAGRAQVDGEEEALAVTSAAGPS
jgi:Kef-type K+ transport system membrane component KefB